MKFNQKGLDLIKSFEGCKLKAYPDPGTGGSPWTIGYGSTLNVHQGDLITQDQAEAFLQRDVDHICGKVSPLVTAPLNDNQFSALVSFAYNLGPSNLKNSTLLKLVNKNQLPAAANEFVKWNKAAGRVLDGLTKRRLAEKELFLLPIA